MADDVTSPMETTETLLVGGSASEEGSELHSREVVTQKETAAATGESAEGDGGNSAKAEVEPLVGKAATKPWYEEAGIAPEFLTDKIKTMKGPGDLAKSLVNAERLLGQRNAVKPAADAPAELWAKYRQAMGVPESADGYEWEAPESAMLDPEELKEFRETAHGMDLTPEQFSQVMNHYAGLQDRAMARLADTQVAERQQTVSRLKQVWGDEYEANLQEVQEAARRTGLGEMFRDLGVGNSHQAILALHTIARYLPEQQTADGAAGFRDVATEISAIEKSAAYMDRMHPGHADAMKRRDELYRQRIRR